MGGIDLSGGTSGTNREDGKRTKFAGQDTLAGEEIESLKNY